MQAEPSLGLSLVKWSVSGGGMKRSIEKETAMATHDHEEPREGGHETQAKKKVMILPWMALGVLLGCAALVLVAYGLQLGMTSFLMVELLLAVAAAAVGCLLGFLFGMPQSSVSESDVETSDDARLRYIPSTNLGQISDWLTKILIGVGLVEIRQIGEALERMGAFVQRSVDGAPSVTNFVSQVVVIAFVVGGFLASFLWTRIYYGPLQTITDSNVVTALQQAIEKLRSKVLRQESDAEEVKTVTKMIARGELAVPSAMSSTATDTLLASGATRDVTLWPDDIREKLERFQKAPKRWNSDPAGQLFRTASREGNGYRFEAEIHEKMSDALIITLRVRRVDGEPSSGPVMFLLHPTLRERVQHAEFLEGIAETKVYAEGWFTAVALIPSGSVVLKYDLREIEGAPAWFKEEEE
jgi:hypothetical protein